MNKIERLIYKVLWKILSNNKRINYLRKRGVKIGDGCSISSDVKFGSEPYLVEVGNNVRLTSNVQFITHDGSLWVLRNLGMVNKYADKFGKINIGNNVNIGWNAVIMPGVSIGDNCIIGVGSIVTKSIPKNSVVAGIPAKVIQSVDDYYEKNKDQLEITKHMNAEQKRAYLEIRY